MMCSNRARKKQQLFFLALHDSINDMKLFLTLCIIPQPCQCHFSCWLLPIWPKLDFLGWKWSLWPMPAWLAVQQSKYVFFLTLYDSINDRNLICNFCITPQPCHSHFFLIAANLALAASLGWKLSLWPTPAWLEVQWSKETCFLTLYDSINDIRRFWNFFIAPQPCHSHFSCWLLPIWP